MHAGSSNSPSQISDVVAEMDELNTTNLQLSISWDPLPCHLQNGADITDYIIQYNLTSTNETRSISTSDDRLSCRQEPVGPYRCYLTSSLLLEDQMYTFQVAAMNGYGVGPFSDPVKATLHSLMGKHSFVFIIIIMLYNYYNNIHLFSNTHLAMTD